MVGRCIAFLLFGIWGFLEPSYAAPDFKRGSIILDDETETVFQGWIEKLFAAANLKTHRPKVYILVDPDINAAAAPGGRVFINTGFILECANVDQFMGVMAHEVGHIASNHSDMGEAFNEGLIPAAAAILIGGLATAATGDPSALMAGFMGGQHMLERTMLRFSRTQEAAADQAGMTYLDRLGWTSKGLVDFFKILEAKNPVILQYISKYALTHPLTNDRIIAVQSHLDLSKLKTNPFPTEMEEKFQRIKAKISGFMDKPEQILKRYPQSRKDIAALYAQAILAYRRNSLDTAISLLDDLLQKLPNDPYFHELKGQILFDHGRISESVTSFKKARSLKPNSPLIALLLAQAYLESKNPADWQEALKILLPLSQKKHENVFIYRLLATAYGRLNNPGMVKLSLAEEACGLRKILDAKAQLNHALKLLPKDSPGYQRAQDLMHALNKRILTENTL